MSGGFSNKPKIIRGAFVEYGLSLPPLFVVFQFNPIQLTRNRSLSYSPPNSGTSCPADQRRTREKPATLRGFHMQNELMDIQKNQVVTLEEESISFEIRLDATDKLNEGDGITQMFGIEPQLAALESMVYPKEESLLGDLLGSVEGFSFTRGENPPMVIFIWGYKRVLPVNINKMDITETEFNTNLSPIRATVSVSLTVIEGKNLVYKYSKAAKEVMAAMNLANIADIANVVIPG